MLSLTASTYVSLDRASPDIVRELDKVINAPPTSIKPEERERFLSALLDDLRPDPNAPWTRWTEDTHLVALTAVKTLGRNPIGSEILLSDGALTTVLFHAALRVPAGPDIASPPAPARPSHTSPHALEALRVLANTLVLHPAGRRRLAVLGGGAAVAAALTEADSLDNADRLFLLGRVGFLVTVERGAAIQEMMEGSVVESLVLHLTTLAPATANFNALSELLKLTNNVLRFFPHDAKASATEEPWDKQLDPLLPPIISLVHHIPFSDLSPPLTHALHALLPIPLTASNEAEWAAVPAPARRASSTSSAPPSPPSVTRPVKALMNKISQMGPASPRRSAEAPRKSSDGLAPPYQARRRPSDGLAPPEDAKGLGVPRSRSPSPSSPQSPASPTAGAEQTTQVDPVALPIRVLGIIEEWFATHLPYQQGPDEVAPNVPIEEALPPVLLLLTKLAGSTDMRVYMKARLLPADLDRSNEAGPLERRRGLLGDLLRLLGSSHTQCRDTAGEFFWALCGEDPTDLSVEIGYGNAAGLLFRKGLTCPPPAKLEMLDPASAAASLAPRADVNPITAIRDDATPAAAMTPDEAEREAERLFVLFDRLEKNPVISAHPGDGAAAGAHGTGNGKGTGHGQPRGIREAMRQKVEEGVADRWDVDEAERERAQREQEDADDEVEAAREVAALRKRQGRA
ncbi:hypothetical protein Q5752_004424 [Cryptotrichosporon argae]